MPGRSSHPAVLAMPWLAFGLTLVGGMLLAGSREPLLRLLGALAAGSAVVLMALLVQRVRRRIQRVLAAIPFKDKSEFQLQELPRAWARLEAKVTNLSQQLEREDNLRWNILSSLRTGVVVFRKNGRVRLFNPAARTLLGTSSHLNVGSTLADVLREPASLRNLERAVGGETLEWSLKRGGRIMQLRAVAFEGVAEASDEEDGVLLTLEDITRQEALETTRQKFISNASHELKTPATSIRIAAEDLLEGQLVLPDGEMSLRIILRNVDRMALLLHDISELSRIETGALHLEPCALTVTAFAQGLVEDALVRAQERDIAIDLQIPVELAETVFQADPNRLHQLLENLLSNAVKFSPAGSAVTLAVRQEDGHLVWQVTDRGPGIDKADLARIFERFYRAPSARAVPGTGLGLAIVKHLALLMNGEVDVASEPGKGSTFTLRLPWAES